MFDLLLYLYYIRNTFWLIWNVEIIATWNADGLNETWNMKHHISCRIYIELSKTTFFQINSVRLYSRWIMKWTNLYECYSILWWIPCTSLLLCTPEFIGSSVFWSIFEVFESEWQNIATKLKASGGIDSSVGNIACIDENKS